MSRVGHGNPGLVTVNTPTDARFSEELLHDPQGCKVLCKAMLGPCTDYRSDGFRVVSTCIRS